MYSRSYDPDDVHSQFGALNFTWSVRLGIDDATGPKTHFDVSMAPTHLLGVFQMSEPVLKFNTNGKGCKCFLP